MLCSKTAKITSATRSSIVSTVTVAKTHDVCHTTQKCKQCTTACTSVPYNTLKQTTKSSPELTPDTSGLAPTCNCWPQRACSTMKAVSHRRQPHQYRAHISTSPPQSHCSACHQCWCSSPRPNRPPANHRPYTQAAVSVTGLLRDTAWIIRLNLPPALQGLKPAQALSAHKLSGALLV